MHTGPGRIWRLLCTALAFACAVLGKQYNVQYNFPWPRHSLLVHASPGRDWRVPDLLAYSFARDLDTRAGPLVLNVTLTVKIGHSGLERGEVRFWSEAPGERTIERFCPLDESRRVSRNASAEVSVYLCQVPVPQWSWHSNATNEMVSVTLTSFAGLSYSRYRLPAWQNATFALRSRLDNTPPTIHALRFAPLTAFSDPAPRPQLFAMHATLSDIGSGAERVCVYHGNPELGAGSIACISAGGPEWPKWTVLASRTVGLRTYLNVTANVTLAYGRDLGGAVTLQRQDAYALDRVGRYFFLPQDSAILADAAAVAQTVQLPSKCCGPVDALVTVPFLTLYSPESAEPGVLNLNGTTARVCVNITVETDQAAGGFSHGIAEFRGTGWINGAAFELTRAQHLISESPVDSAADASPRVRSQLHACLVPPPGLREDGETIASYLIFLRDRAENYAWYSTSPHPSPPSPGNPGNTPGGSPGGGLPIGGDPNACVVNCGGRGSDIDRWIMLIAWLYVFGVGLSVFALCCMNGRGRSCSACFALYCGTHAQSRVKSGPSKSGQVLRNSKETCCTEYYVHLLHPNGETWSYPTLVNFRDCCAASCLFRGPHGQYGEMLLAPRACRSCGCAYLCDHTLRDAPLHWCSFALPLGLGFTCFLFASFLAENTVGTLVCGVVAGVLLVPLWMLRCLWCRKVAVPYEPEPAPLPVGPAPTAVELQKYAQSQPQTVAAAITADAPSTNATSTGGDTASAAAAGAGSSAAAGSAGSPAAQAGQQPQGPPPLWGLTAVTWQRWLREWLPKVDDATIVTYAERLFGSRLTALSEVAQCDETVMAQLGIAQEHRNVIISSAARDSDRA